MKTKNLPLIIGITLPIVFIVIISIIIYIPALSIRPSYNFIYTTNDDYAYNQVYRNTYNVVNGHIALQNIDVKPPLTNQVYKGDAPDLFFYDVKTNTATKITPDQAKAYTLDPGPTSPDGYTINYEYSNEGIFSLFGSNSRDSGYFIEKNSGRKRLDGLVGQNGTYYYQGYVKILGWIK